MNRLIDPLIPAPCELCMLALTIDVLLQTEDELIDDHAAALFHLSFLSNN